jgi:VCBS repeat-containing protein
MQGVNRRFDNARPVGGARRRLTWCAAAGALATATAVAALPVDAGAVGANRAPTAVDDATRIAQQGVPDSVTGNVLVNDIEPDGDTLTVRTVVGAVLPHGTFTIRSNGTFRFTLDNTNADVIGLASGQTLSDVFSYTVSDGRGGTSRANVRITIIGNRAPSAADDTTSIVEDATPNSVTGNVLGNDNDPDGDILAVRTVVGATLPHGTFTIRTNGTYRFTLDNTNVDLETLDAGQSLTDTFTYTVHDGNGHATTATLRIRIDGATDNKPPTPRDDLNSVREDTAPNPVSGNVLIDDDDPDGDTLSVTSIGTFDLPHGRLVIGADGQYSYTLDNTNVDLETLDVGQSLTDSFTYTVSDGKGHTATAILRIRIAGVTDNKAPTPEDDLNSVREDSLPNPISDNVLFNDVDPDGDTLTVTNTGQFDLGHGVLTIRADGGYTYALDNTDIDVDDLDTGQSLTDSFTYNVSDGHGHTASAVLRIRINGITDLIPV